MAPMEPATADDGSSAEVLEKALADQTADQLREVTLRLLKSTEGMKEMLAELEAEKHTLREESEHLNSTICLMMQEMHKLNIGAGNTVEPRLDEGPLDFVGRLWEKVKPRDTAYQTSEHVGEIKKPVPGQEAPLPVQQVVQKASQEVVQKAQEIRTALGPASQEVAQKAQEIRTALGPLWARTQTFLSEKQNELAGQVAAARAKQRQRAGTDGNSSRSGGYANGSTAPAAPEATAAASKDQPAAEAAAAAGEEAAACSAGGAPSGAAPAPEEAAAAAAVGDKGEGEVAAAPAATEAATPASGEEQSTILIEARLKVDDGSVLTLHVRAADRCKEVAQRFVQENSLKAWFQEPLTAWLKKVEADAVKFPVEIEGDLMEIRKQYSKRK